MSSIDEVEEIASQEQVIRAFLDLSDLLREIVEERETTIRKRQSLRNKVIRKLMKTYW